jgi:hypothetical protein
MCHLPDLFDATHSMYDDIAFVREANGDSRTCLEWGRSSIGLTSQGQLSLAKIRPVVSRASVLSRPYRQTLAFSAELARRLTGNRC